MNNLPKKRVIYSAIYTQNLKTTLSFAPFYIVAALWIVAEIVLSLLMSNLSSYDSAELLSRLKTFWAIHFIIQAIFISLLAIIICYYLLSKQKDNGMHSLEIRLGVSIRNIYFIRVLIYLSSIILLVSIIFILNIALLCGIGTLDNSLIWTKIMPIFGYSYLYAFLSGSFMLLIFSLFKGSFASLFGISISILFALSPFLNMIGYSSVSSDKTTLINMQMNARVNTRLMYSQKWYEVTKKDREASILDQGIVQEYNSHLSIITNDDGSKEYPQNNLLDLYGFQMGDLISSETYRSVTAGDTQPNNANAYINQDKIGRFTYWKELQNFQKMMAAESTGIWEDYQGNLSPFSGKQKIDSTYSIKNYVNHLLSTDTFKKDIKFNAILNFVKDIGDDTMMYNNISNHSKVLAELEESYTAGDIFEYNTQRISAQDYNKIYNSDMPRVVIWLVLNSIAQNNYLDAEEAHVLLHGYEKNGLVNINHYLNPMTQLMSMGQGEQFNKQYLQDMWTINQKVFTNYSMFRFKHSDVTSLKLPDLDLDSWPPMTTTRATIMSRGASGSQIISKLDLKPYKNYSLIATFIAYYMISFLFIFLGFLSYKTNTIK